MGLFHQVWDMKLSFLMLAFVASIFKGGHSHGGGGNLGGHDQGGGNPGGHDQGGGNPGGHDQGGGLTKVGDFQTKAHGVVGQVFIKHGFEQTLVIKGFRYDGTAPDAFLGRHVRHTFKTWNKSALQGPND